MSYPPRVRRTCHFLLLFALWLSSSENSPAVAQCPFVQQQEILASDPMEEDFLGGGPLDLDGGWLALGSPTIDDLGEDSGAVYLFRFDGTGWTETQKITEPAGEAFYRFGDSLGLSGDVLAVVAKGHRRAYVFRFDEGLGMWREEQAFDLPFIPGETAVEIEGDVLLISGNGRVFPYFYDVQSQMWLPGEIVFSPSSGRFGSALSISGQKVLIGAEDISPGRLGTAHIYHLDVDRRALDLFQTFTANDRRKNVGYGDAVALCGDIAIVSSPWDNDQGPMAGSVYVYRFNGTFWQQEQEIEPLDPQRQAFGSDVALDRGLLCIGSSLRTGNAVRSGAAYLYRLDGNQFFLEQELIVNNGQADDYFGTSVTLDGPVSVIAACAIDRFGMEDVGGAYSFSGIQTALAGTVNLGAGPASNVLFVNGMAGGRDRIVDVSLGEPLTFALTAPPAGPDEARYSCFVWDRAPRNCQVLRFGGETLGFLVNPVFRQGNLEPMPIRCLSSPEFQAACRGLPSPLGAPLRAPWMRTRPNGLQYRSLLTIQAVIDDLGAGNGQGRSVSNSVTIRVR